MDLTESQQDSLAELINIGYGRAAGALSELTGYRITLEVPEVAMHTLDRIAELLGSLIPSQVASVDQVFSGPISGRAYLLLDQRAALVLSQLLTESFSETSLLDSNARETITEVGNILLNACLGVFGNLLHVHVSFHVPRFRLDTVASVLGAVDRESEESRRYGLMIHTRFHIKTKDIAGYLVIVLGIASLDRLLAELDQWEQKQLT
jgi:chemotaxis protein CheC